MSFDTKYRPIKFEDVVGQKGTVNVLKKLVKTKQVFHKSYIFAGPSGTGKTTTARILARAMLCDDVNPNTGEPCNQCESCREIIDGTSSFSFVEMDAANNSGADKIRQIVDELDYYTLGGKDRKIYLIDECFTEDTELMTEEGLQSIRTLVEQKYKGKVLSYDTDKDEVVWKRVTDWFDIPDERETLRLTFDNGVELTVTTDQELYTTNRGWVKACELTEDDDICETQFSKVDIPREGAEKFLDVVTPHIHESMKYKVAKLIKSESLGKRKVYDVTVEDTHSFFAASTHGKQTHAVLAHNCHRLSAQAMDALLKPMEDNVTGSKDKRLVCLFCTTEPEKIRNTIKARCMMFGIKEPEREEAVDRLRWICEEENISHTDEALDIIYSFGRGQIRDMVNALERVAQAGPVTSENARKHLGLGAVSNYYLILENLRDNLPKALSLTEETLRMVDPPAFYEGIADAAMASYRSSWDIMEGIGYVDQEKAKKVFSLYDENVLWIADRILGSSKKVDENVLTCELIILHRFLKDGTIFSSNNVQGGRGTAPEQVNSNESCADDSSEESSSENDSDDMTTTTIPSEYNVDVARELANDISKTGSHFVNPDMPANADSGEEDEDDVNSLRPLNPNKSDLRNFSAKDARKFSRRFFDD